ncbi:hypothetical protein [Amycolatopsis sp. FDAARGOS 1241]|uniref:hypothetical protein n=1 Tax=Amycolatopsis sp. FDAARGOS 1241 TaxID=2778070 RepID=UPI001951591C|nr:hypothetical protein [Amycolatopsis sp. FDAARGOS 1241]QRP48776.1 hypothetical protein I6J71_13720 [Amycolatopsis sp. FDAARGOS 1241]
MLYIVLVLVLAALALLVTALITAGSLWAWVSIGLSVLAGLLLLADWLRRRNRPEPAPTKPAAEESAEKENAEKKDVKGGDGEQTALLPSTGQLGAPADLPEPAGEPEPQAEPASEQAEAATAEPATAAQTTTEPAAETAAAEETADPGRDVPPAEEETSADDLAVVKELGVEVVVVDEYPRYHLVDCPWLSGRDAIPLGVGEARQLGFTPCGRCGPDAVLARAHRRR